jgi:hypothetical protein
MAPAEGERQIFVAKPDQIGVAGRRRPRMKLADGERGGQFVQKIRKAVEEGAMAAADEIDKVRFPDLVVVDEDAAAHDVEGDVGEMMRGRQRRTRALQPIRRSHQRGQLPRPAGDVVFQLRHQDGAIAAQPVQQSGNPAVILVYVGDQAPASCDMTGQRQFGAEQVGAAAPLDIVFRGHRLASAEGVELLRGEQIGAGCPARPARRSSP